jgi:hypothetical protein
MIGSKVMNRFILFLSVFIIGFSACELENVEYSDIPNIEFKDLKVKDSLDLLGNPSRLITLHFYLIDGDGDIGPINSPDYIGNCNLELFFLKDLVYQNDTTILDTIRWTTIPYVGYLGQDKALKADVFIDIEYNAEPQMSYKNYFYKITVFDMVFNKSNTISTDTIILSELSY